MVKLYILVIFKNVHVYLNGMIYTVIYKCLNEQNRPTWKMNYMDVFITYYQMHTGRSLTCQSIVYCYRECEGFTLQSCRGVRFACVTGTNTSSKQSVLLCTYCKHSVTVILQAPQKQMQQYFYSFKLLKHQQHVYIIPTLEKFTNRQSSMHEIIYSSRQRMQRLA